MKKYIGGLCILLLAINSYSLTFKHSGASSDIVGEVKVVKSQSGETMMDVARTHDLGYYEMLEANPSFNPNSTLSTNTSVIIPGQFILPSGPKRGIVINLSELRLYYYRHNKIITEPVGVGREDWETPLGTTSIIEKIPNPTWYPTKNVREDAKKFGQILPEFIGPGPDNPLGKFAMRLAWREYLIHGTNKPEGVGRPSSAGCIRMYPEDIETLFSVVPRGTSVRIVDEPVKIGMRDRNLYIEVHAPLHEPEVSQKEIFRAMKRIFAKASQNNLIVHWSKVQLEIEKHTGVPEIIS